jgi:murein tripeptide amidase MpaA
MALIISSAFDAGNIRVLRQDESSAELEIVKDHMSDFYQWFYFRIAGAAGREITLRITNCAGSAYPHGWPDYKGVMSLDREEWVRIQDTSYADGVLTMKLTPPQDPVWIAYFAPYSMERHHDLVTQTAAMEGVGYRSLGKSLDGQDLDCLTFGEGPLNVWLYARQHPGESMAEWWMEGALEKLVDEDDPVARVLRKECTFRVVPNMNPDGSRRGHLRTNAVGANLNREWHAPTAERSPEVLCVRNAMDETGVDFAMDVHGDEAIPANFLAGFEGIPSLSDRQQRAGGGRLGHARFGQVDVPPAGEAVLEVPLRLAVPQQDQSGHQAGSLTRLAESRSAAAFFSSGSTAWSASRHA